MVQQAAARRRWAWGAPLPYVIVAAFLWRRQPLFEGRMPLAIVTAVLCVALIAERLRPSARPVANALRGAWFTFIAASWAEIPWPVSVSIAIAGGLFTGVLARPGERAFAGVSLGGAMAVAWNAWRFGAPPLRVFAVAACAAVGVAVAPAMRGWLRARLSR